MYIIYDKPLSIFLYFSPESISLPPWYHSIWHPCDATHPPLTGAEIYNGCSGATEINGLIIGFLRWNPAINGIHQNEKKDPFYKIQGSLLKAMNCIWQNLNITIRHTQFWISHMLNGNQKRLKTSEATEKICNSTTYGFLPMGRHIWYLKMHFIQNRKNTIWTTPARSVLMIHSSIFSYFFNIIHQYFLTGFIYSWL